MSTIRVGSGNPFEEVYGYARAVRVGELILVSGTTPRSEDLGDGAYVQLSSAISIVAAALKELGAGLDDVVRTVVYATDLSDMEGLARAHREAFGAARPAATVVQVASLTPAAARVEIEVTAKAP